MIKILDVSFLLTLIGFGLLVHSRVAVIEGATLFRADIDSPITSTQTDSIIHHEGEAHRTFRQTSNSVGSNFTTRQCNICKFSVGLMNYAIKSRRGSDGIYRITNQFCSLAQIESPSVCRNVTKLFENEVVKVLGNGLITPDQICGLLSNNTCGTYHNPLGAWEVNLNITRLDLNNEDDEREVINDRPILNSNGPNRGEKFRIIHISDPHVDLNYVADAEANCKEPICCQATSTPNQNTSETRRAGYWGNDRCDIPLRTLDSALDKIRQLLETNPDIAYIVWTGDLQPHDVWKQTKQHAMRTYETIFERMVQFLPSIPIIPTLGNHEMIPVDSFSPSNLLHIADQDSPEWLYKTMNVFWSRWLPKSTEKTIIRDGFYSVKIRDGLRVISLNTNYCHNKNFWLYIDSRDPGNQLDWLIHELYLSELANEKVHIIGHIPPGCSDCFKVWSRNFNKIIRRFANTVSAQFYGHTHKDEFQIFYDNIDKSIKTNEVDRVKPVSVGFIGPALTPVGGNNPGFRIYTIDPSLNYAVVDYETYFMDLKSANRATSSRPAWLSAGNFTRRMSLPNTLPGSMQQLILEMNNELLSEPNFTGNGQQHTISMPDILTKISNQSKSLELYKLSGLFSDNFDDGSFEKLSPEARRNFLCSYITSSSHDTSFCDLFIKSNSVARV